MLAQRNKKKSYHTHIFGKKREDLHKKRLTVRIKLAMNSVGNCEYEEKNNVPQNHSSQGGQSDVFLPLK